MSTNDDNDVVVFADAAMLLLLSTLSLSATAVVAVFIPFGIHLNIFAVFIFQLVLSLPVCKSMSNNSKTANYREKKCWKNCVSKCKCIANAVVSKLETSLNYASILLIIIVVYFQHIHIVIRLDNDVRNGLKLAVGWQYVLVIFGAIAHRIIRYHYYYYNIIYPHCVGYQF